MSQYRFSWDLVSFDPSTNFIAVENISPPVASTPDDGGMPIAVGSEAEALSRGEEFEKGLHTGVGAAGPSSEGHSAPSPMDDVRPWRVVTPVDGSGRHDQDGHFESSDPSTGDSADNTDMGTPPLAYFSHFATNALENTSYTSNFSTAELTEFGSSAIGQPDGLSESENANFFTGLGPLSVNGLYAHEASFLGSGIQPEDALSDLSFSLTNQSALGPNVSSGGSWSLPSWLSFSDSVSKSTSVLDTSVTGSISISGGLTGQFSLTPGDFSVNYPIAVDAKFPNAVKDGQSFTVDTSSFSVDGALLTLTGPGASANLDLSLSAQASLQIGDFFKGTIDLGLDSSLTLSKDLDGTFGKISIAAPSPFTDSSQLIDATDSLPALTVSGTDDPFLTASLDLASAASAIFGGPPLSGSYLFGDYDFLSAELTGGVAIAQDITFAPVEVDVTLKASDGEIRTGVLGQSFTFTAPSSGTGTLEIDATYTLKVDVITKTGLVATLGFDISALEATAFGAQIGPLFSATIPASGSAVLGSLTTLSDQSFDESLVSNATYDINYSSSSPNPPPPPPPTSSGPSVNINKGLSVQVGSSGEISSALLAATDPSYSDSQLTYVVINQPAYGTLVVDGKSGQGSFTQTDLDNGSVRYQENGTTASTDSLTFEVFDPAGHNTAIQTFNIQITPVSPPPPAAGPSVVTDNGLTLLEGTTATISPSALKASDPNFADASVKFVLVNGPSYGTLTDNGNALVSGSTFTQADINNSLLQYHETVGTTASDHFSFEVIDPNGNETLVESFLIQVTQPPPPPPPPSAPNVTIGLAEDTGTSNNDSYTSDATLVGAADPNSQVVISESGVTLGTTTTNASGVWTFTPSSLAQGFHVIQASETNLAGITGSALVDFTLDTVTPATPSVPVLSGGGNVTLTATPTFTGTCGVSDNATILLYEGSTIIGSGVESFGNWAITTNPLSAGAHTITAVAFDDAGNVSGQSSTETFQVATPPPGEVILNDATMVDAGDLVSVGSVTAPPFSGFSGTVTEYGSISADGFTLTNLSRSAYSFITWDSDWTSTHSAGYGGPEDFDGPDVLIVPTDSLTVAEPPNSTVGSAVADTIDLSRPDGAAFSLTSVDLGPTGYYPTVAVFTGTTADGTTVTETVELNESEGASLRTVALTGFNDVVDVKFTEHLGAGGEPTSIEFDNLVLGAATPPVSPSPSGLLTSQVVLDDNTMVSLGQLPLVSSDFNVFIDSTFSQYGTVGADGFEISNLDRSDYAFNSPSSSWAASYDYFFDGPNVLWVPGPENGVATSSRIQIDRQDGGAFSLQSIALDTIAGYSGVTVTFTGVRPGGSNVTETVQLDSQQGFQTFEFGSVFSDVASVQFAASNSTGGGYGFQFDAIDLLPAIPPTPSGIVLSLAADTHTLVIAGNGEAGDTVTLDDGTTAIGTAIVGADGSWSVAPTTALASGLHSLIVTESNSDEDSSGGSSVITYLAGTAGDDVLTATAANETIDISQGGDDRVNCGIENVTIIAGGTLTASDRIHGGTGYDTIVLDGDYSAGLTFKDSTMVGVDELYLTGGHSYRLTTKDANIAAGQTLTIDGSTLGPSDVFAFNGSAETNGTFAIDGGAGENVLTGGAGNDVFNLANTGKDIVNGEGGNDTFNMGASLNFADRINGGTGSDTIALDGDYSHGLTFKSTTMINIGTLSLATGYSYKFTTSDATVAAGQTLTIDGSALGSDNALSFNGSAETDSSFVVIGGEGHNSITGGAGNDIFKMQNGGKDVIHAGAGNDGFYFADGFTVGDSVDGGSGNDKLVLGGDYTGSSALLFHATTITNVESLILRVGYSYDITTNDANVAAGHTLTVDGSALGESDTLTFNGAAEKDGTLTIFGGVGNDSLTGGTYQDVFNGGGGADKLTSNGGVDTFVYGSASDSTSSAYDTIQGFNASTDFLKLNFNVTAVDTAVTAGYLDKAHFDKDLAQDVGAAQLGMHHAVIFTANGGAMSGDTFLIIDVNGAAGYQAGQDLVIQLSGAVNLASLSTSEFLT